MATLATIQVPAEYGYVLIVAAGSYALSSWLGIRIGPYRIAANVPHPNTYASAEAIANASSAKEKRAMYLFNCAQRAHKNFVENYTAFLTGMFISGLEYPKFSAAAGLLWIVGRVVYAIGYTDPSEKNVDGKGRWAGGGFHLAAVSQVAYIVLVGKIGVDMLKAGW